jgi:hypothetical protein
VENKAEIMQHVLKMQQISLLPKCIKHISSGVFLHVFAHATQVSLSLSLSLFKNRGPRIHI